jgi:hypothetical protein
MLPILLLAAVASLIFLIDEKAIVKAQQIQGPNKKTYKNLVKDLMENHGITQTKWKNNLRINKYLDGIIIGSDEGFIHLSDFKPIRLYLGSNKVQLNTWDVKEAIEKMKKMLNSESYNDSDKKIITNILNDLLKYQDYYYLKKYLKYKKLYNKLKKSN